MKLSEWAKSQGIGYQTALRWFHKGSIPVPSYQNSKTGTIIVTPLVETEAKDVAFYARGSSSNQKEDLERRIGQLIISSMKEKRQVIEIVSEILKLLADTKKATK